MSSHCFDCHSLYCLYCIVLSVIVLSVIVLSVIVLPVIVSFIIVLFVIDLIYYLSKESQDLVRLELGLGLMRARTSSEASQNLVRGELGHGPGSSQYYVRFASDGKNMKFLKTIFIRVISGQIQATFKVNLHSTWRLPLKQCYCINSKCSTF